MSDLPTHAHRSPAGAPPFPRDASSAGGDSVDVAGIRLPVRQLMAAACPHCGAGPGQRCRNPSLGRVSPGQSHMVRARLARQVAENGGRA